MTTLIDAIPLRTSQTSSSSLRFVGEWSNTETPLESGFSDWSDFAVADLCNELTTGYRQPLQDELSRIGSLLCRVAEGHAERHPELDRVLDLFSHFAGDLKQHLSREDSLIFPVLLTGDRQAALSSEVIEAFEQEHRQSLRSLAQIRELTHDYQPPTDACGTYRRVLNALSGLEQKLHDTINIEDNILFPRIQRKSVAIA